MRPWGEVGWTMHIHGLALTSHCTKFCGLCFWNIFYVGTRYITKIWFVVVPRPLDGGAESTFKILLTVMTVHRAKFSISSYSS